jgi:flagellar basal-body rod modification protein FlgD
MVAAMTARSGRNKYTLTATATNGSGNSVGVSTQIQGVVSSVDLTQSPPLLMIDGQSYTVNQVKGIAD